MPDTRSVAVTFTLDSSDATPPYEIGTLTGLITYDDSSTLPFRGWVVEDVGTPDPNGATFSLNVVDSNYANGATTIDNWALAFIPRPGTSQNSPFGNNVNMITGNGFATNQLGNFGLNLNNAKIKNAGSWDWALMIQVQLPDGTIKCFASDPQMDVDS